MPFDGTNYKQEAVLDVLRRARDRVARPDGWCQGYLHRRGQVCLIGSLLERGQFGAGIIDISDAQRISMWIIESLIPTQYLSPARYNDAHERTQAEIVALLDLAIAKREAELQTRGA